MENKTVETAFIALEEIIKKLEDENVTLDHSLKLYNEGIDLLKYCNQSIDTIEKQIIILSEEGKQSDV